MRVEASAVLRVVFLLLFLAGTARFTEAQTKPTRLLESALDEWLQPYLDAGDFSGVVLVGEGDRLVVAKAYGMADQQNGIPNKLFTQFQAASVSKSFTAGAIRLLIRHGKLRLEDPLSRYVSGIPNGEKITIRHLLAHESGIAELDTPDFFRECLPTEEIVRRLRKSHPQFEPGKDESGCPTDSKARLVKKKLFELGGQRTLRRRILKVLRKREVKPKRGIFEKVPSSGAWWIRYIDSCGRYRREKIGTYSAAEKLYPHGNKKLLKVGSCLRLFVAEPFLLENSPKMRALT